MDFKKIALGIIGGWCLMIMIGSFSSCNSSKSVLQNQWSAGDSTIVVDGSLVDWSGSLHQPNNYTDIEFDIANDAKDLFVCVRIPDKSIQRRIMGLGLSVYIDTLAKKRDKIGIGYPLPLTQEQIETISFQAQKDGIKIDNHALDEAYAKICQEFELIGFVEEDATERIRVSNLASKEIKTAMGFDHVGAMICEMKIPLMQLYNRQVGYNETISLGIRVNQPTPNADDEPGLFDDPRTNPITASSQMQNQMGGGLNGQPAATRRPSRSVSGNITGVWVKANLAQPK